MARLAFFTLLVQFQLLLSGWPTAVPGHDGVFVRGQVVSSQLTTLPGSFQHYQDRGVIGESARIERNGDDSAHRRRLFLDFLFSWLLWPNCPPPGFDSLNPFDIDSYISALWYPVKAAPVIYAPGQSYCSVVQYTRDTGCVFFCGDNPRIEVRNRGRRGAVDGPINSAQLPAFVPDPDLNPAKIKVSGFQRFVSTTNYWIVAAGTYNDAVASRSEGGPPLQRQPTSNQYDWAIIAGAAPFRDTGAGKCISGYGWFDTRGLWMFARNPEPPEGVIPAVEDLADSMGLDTTVWLPVIHEGCVYPTFDD